MTRFDVVVTWTTANAPQIGAACLAVAVLGALGVVVLDRLERRP